MPVDPSSSPASASCPNCGSPLPEQAPQGLCPKCLFAALAVPTEGPGAAASPIPAPSPDDLAPHFPQLEILDCLGRGGMGVVYRARQKSLDRLVALKLLAPERVNDPVFAERFTREAQALAKLNHPNIVTVHDFGKAGGFFYLLMEFVDGVNLRQAMKAGRFTPEQALAIVPPVCEALQYAHEHGIVHRDIKPENLLLDRAGRVMIADFGIAKMLGAESATGLAESQPAGTPQYMAPEQRTTPGTVDHRADIYSLGVVFYEMLTGELPAQRLEAPSRKVHLDIRIDEIVLRALEQKPELRFATAADFRTQVETVAHSSAVFPSGANTPDSWEYRSPRKLFGLPLLHVAAGVDPATGQWRVARGFFAFGGIARGVFAFGGRATGVVAFGGVATGLIAMGGVAIGLLALGGLALALLFAFGGLSVAPLALGGTAIGAYACGGVAMGYYAQGGVAVGQYAIGEKFITQHAVERAQDMPEILQFLGHATPWVGPLYLVLFALLLLLSLLVPRWARKQVLPSLPPSPAVRSAGPPATPRLALFASLLVIAIGLIGWAVWPQPPTGRIAVENPVAKTVGDPTDWQDVTVLEAPHFVPTDVRPPLRAAPNTVVKSIISQPQLGYPHGLPATQIEVRVPEELRQGNIWNSHWRVVVFQAAPEPLESHEWAFLTLPSDQSGWAALNLTGFSSVFYVTKDKIRKVVLQYRPEIPEAPRQPNDAFGPTVERTLKNPALNRANGYLDFESGSVVSLPEAIDAKDAKAVLVWARQNGIDVMADTSEQVRGLLGFQLHFALIPDSQWDYVTLDSIVRAVSAQEFHTFKMGGSWDEDESTQWVASANTVTTRPGWRTFAFRTRENSLGVLQLLEVSDEPNGFVKLRYKLAPRAIPAGSSNPAATPSAPRGVGLADGLQAVLELQAPVGSHYVLGEVVGVSFHFRNTSDHPISFACDAGMLTIIDENGSKIHPGHVFISAFIARQRQTLRPGESIAIRGEPVAFLPEGDTPIPDSVQTYVRLKPGRHTLRYRLRLPEDDPAKPQPADWLGELETAPVTIEVRAPEPAAVVDPSSNWRK